jgi:hypothetical protein
MAPASGSGRSGRTMSGPMTSSRTGPMTGGSIAPQHHRRVHPGGAHDPCRPQAQLDRCPRRPDRSLHPAGPPEYIRSDNGPEFVANRSGTGSPRLAPRPPTSSLAHPGRTATSRASTPGSGTNCSTARSSIHSERRRSSSSGGASTTTPSARTAPWDTARRPLKASSQWIRGPTCTNTQTGPLSGGRPDLRERGG